MRKLLLIFAHPAMHKSQVNRQLLAVARECPFVTAHDLYENYPDFNIDISREQELLVQHDVIVWQHPFYWYSAPAIVKEWCDLVLEYGFAYGAGGTSLNGKGWAHALTAGGSRDSYKEGGHNRYTIRELLNPFDQTARLCGMDFLPPFVVFGTLNFGSAKLPKKILDQYQEYLETLGGTVPAVDFLSLPQIEGRA
jgi:glutathione-regulated potassium-efflux system ancillary protein KefG